MESAYKVTDDIHVLPSYVPFPGYGLVPVNAFVLKAREPVLIDTGLRQDGEKFLAEVREIIDPADLRWLWLTHPDPDHTGSLMALMAEAPQLRLITTILGYGFLGLTEAPPLDRVYLLNPGESLDVGDRALTAVKPPSFDNPTTTGFYESKSGAFFSADCFGGLVSAPAMEAGEIAPEDLRQGQTLWATMDAPWLHKVDRGRFASDLKDVREMDPRLVLSAHLPPARGMTDSLLATLAAVPDAPPFVGPTQAELGAMLANMTGSTAGSAE